MGKKIYGPSAFQLLDDLEVTYETDGQTRTVGQMRTGWSSGAIVNFKPGNSGRFKIKFPDVPQRVKQIDEILIISSTYPYSDKFPENTPQTTILVKNIVVKDYDEAINFYTSRILWGRP